MKNLILILAFSFLFSCGNGGNSVDPPADLIPREKMIRLMADVNILEAAIRFNLVRDQKANDSLFNYNIFRAHNVSRKQYETSMRYYGRDQEKMVEMQDEVIAELSKRQAGEKGVRK